MPPRRKPTSTKQKKAEQQLRRAIKRGDVPPPEPKHPQHRKPKHGRIGPTGQVIGASLDASRTVESARKLQSAFVKVFPKYLENTKRLASTMSLRRPIPNHAAIYVDFAKEYQDKSHQLLTCPKRPKWRFDMSKHEVERNEEGVFKKWLAQMDELTDEWQNRDPDSTQSAIQKIISIDQENLSSPTYFERNLEVWRQLWRVTEISQIILVLLDSRCPVLHYPPSLSAYLSDRKVILVLTKVDITGPTRTQAWIEFLHKQYPDMRIVQVESYIEKEAGTEHQGRVQYEPHLPDAFRERLVEAIRQSHSELSEPPKKLSWIPPVKRNIDWSGVLNARGNKVGMAVGGATAPRTRDEEDLSQEERDREPDILTVGLIGQPNVGKSSLLNALFGARKVRASKTPGKTKHFQTLYWTADVRLVDCPGLLTKCSIDLNIGTFGILPISRVSAVPACIYFASQILPLESMLKLEHPDVKLPPMEDKRTWRDGIKRNRRNKRLPAGRQWTFLLLMQTKRMGNAKAGRPDVHRAGNAKNEGQKLGIWIHSDRNNSDEDNLNENDEGLGSDDHSEDEDEGDEDESEKVKPAGLGRFGALSYEDGPEEENSRSEESA
ncbi:hypothetical protein BDQ17DRAFT_1386338 [Cyathus striatus]|nr:hypothetical protein BDQ17DRAFT_1386338 [Cyathus striatus]